MKRRVLARVGGSGAAAAPTTEQFDFTGAAQEFTVPANVCQITVDAYGAAGGDFPSSEEGDEVAGGQGGRATATLAVTPGEVLQVNVGGRGDDAPNEEIVPPAPAAGPGESVRFGNGNPGAAGGFNGGGDGGADENDDPAAGGGGGSDVRQGGFDLVNRAVVAGGGGGAGGNDDAGAGGDGGGSTGDDGSPGGIPPNVAGGDGGTQSSGGEGGGGNAVAGTPGQGGQGGSATDGGGGGGGGGLFGGGGGAADATEAEDDGGGGGGGGSGVGPAGVAFETGVREGDGVVTITYDPDAGGCPAAAAAIAVVVEPRFTG
jgi:Glycine rich protein